jgi:hypothetical protein
MQDLYERIVIVTLGSKLDHNDDNKKKDKAIHENMRFISLRFT